MLVEDLDGIENRSKQLINLKFPQLYSLFDELNPLHVLSLICSIYLRMFYVLN